MYTVIPGKLWIMHNTQSTITQTTNIYFQFYVYGWFPHICVIYCPLECITVIVELTFKCVVVKKYQESLLCCGQHQAESNSLHGCMDRDGGIPFCYSIIGDHSVSIQHLNHPSSNQIFLSIQSF